MYSDSTVTKSSSNVWWDLFEGFWFSWSNSSDAFIYRYISGTGVDTLSENVYNHLRYVWNLFWYIRTQAWWNGSILLEHFESCLNIFLKRSETCLRCVWWRSLRLYWHTNLTQFDTFSTYVLKLYFATKEYYFVLNYYNMK